MIRALILEDEARAASRMQRLIAEIADDIELLGVFESVSDAKEAWKEIGPIELVFSDIQLADGLSFDLFDSVGVPCPVIFTTAYDQYAIKAFKNNGIDYLLKPIDSEELKQALDRFRDMSPKAPGIEELLELARQLNGSRPKGRDRFMVKVGQKLKSIPKADISAFYSRDKGTYILTYEGRNHLLESALDVLMNELDESDFFRVNRSYIVAQEAVEEMIIWSNSRLKLVVKGSDNPDIIVARERTKEFKQWMGAD
jgi:DNA-binding LytR/AlgR family response regulator